LIRHVAKANAVPYPSDVGEPEGLARDLGEPAGIREHAAGVPADVTGRHTLRPRSLVIANGVITSHGDHVRRAAQRSQSGEVDLAAPKIIEVHDVRSFIPHDLAELPDRRQKEQEEADDPLQLEQAPWRLA